MPRNIFESILVQHYDKQSEFDYCQYTSIRFFEILLVEEGEGEVMINKHTIPYASKQLFVFVPNDMYVLKAKTPTTVSTIKFLNSFFAHTSDSTNSTEQKDWFKKIETILHSTNRTTNIQLKSPSEEINLEALFAVMCQEFCESAEQSKVIIENTLHSILHIISRNVGYDKVRTSTSKIQDIINYIHLHIYDGSRLNSRALADEFNISDTYISQYFKKETGVSLKKYILNYKVNLVETRLKYTDLTLSEIASELGFTDSSHLDKTFNAYKGITPGAFRLEQRQVQA